MRCSDDALAYLRAFGYNVVRYPRADLAPLQLFTSEKRELVWLGELTTVLTRGEDIPLPEVKRRADGVHMSGRQTSEMDAKLGVSILGSILGAMGGSNLGLDLKYQRARSVIFEFGDVAEDAVEPAAVDQYLDDAELSAHSRTVAQMLEADDVYVTTAVLRATSLTVTVTSSRSSGVELEAPLIQDLVGANVAVSAAASRGGALTYAGSVPLGFGFQAIRLFYEDGHYRAFTNVPIGTVLRDAAQPPEAGDMFIADGAFARLSFT